MRMSHSGCCSRGYTYANLTTSFVFEEANDRNAWFPDEKTSSSRVISRTQNLSTGKVIKLGVIWIFTYTELNVFILLLSPSVELFDGTQLVEELLVDQTWCKKELVVRHELINNLLFHSLGLKQTNM